MSQELRKKASFFHGDDPTPLLVEYGAPRTVFVPKNPRYVYLSTGIPNMREGGKQIALLIKYDRLEKKVVSMLTLSSSLHDLSYDEERKVLYGVSPVERNIYVIDDHSFKVIKKERCVDAPFYLAINASNDKLFVISHNGGDIGLYALPFLKELKRKRISPEFFYISYSDRLKRIFAASVFDHYVIYSFDENLKNIKHRKGNPYLPIQLGGSSVALNEIANEVYLSVPFERKIYVYDMKTLKRLGYISVPFGVRIMDFDEKRGFLYAGDYVHGNVLVINASSRNIVEKIFVGRKIRDVFFSKSADRLFVASTNGFFEITP